MSLTINPEPIFARMIELDLSRELVCAHTAISRDTLRKIEAGRMVGLKCVSKLCAFLKIKPRDVLTDAGRESVNGHETQEIINAMKEDIREQFVALLKETTDRDALQGIMRTIKSLKGNCNL